MAPKTTAMTPSNVRPYPAYKASGVEWLGDVPDHWDKRKLRSVLTGKTERNRPDLHLLSVVRERGVIRRDVTSKDENRNFIPDDLTSYKVVRAGQFAMNKMKAWQGSYGVSAHDGIVSPAYFVFHLDSVTERYFHIAVRSKAYVPFFGQASDGVRIGQWDLSQARMREIPFFVPSIGEQAAIVRYLHHVDRRVRRYVSTKERLIGLLEEEKQAVIHQAVTHGLDLNVPLKPSGVDWLGDIPEHWEVRTLDRIAVSFRTGPFGSILHQTDYVEDGTPVINPTHMRNGSIVEDPSCSVPEDVAYRLFSYRLGPHDLVFSRRGELGRCALVRSREIGWICGTGSIRIRIDYNDIEPEFLIQALQVQWVGDYLSLASVGATMDNLNTGILKGMPVVLPPIREQRNLLEHIDQQNCTFDAAIDRAGRQVELIQEYRTRLIADVVTGKLDVREAAAGLPDEADDRDPIDESGLMAEYVDGSAREANGAVGELATEGEVTL